jgi:hypothetical protein
MRMKGSFMWMLARLEYTDERPIGQADTGFI